MKKKYVTPEINIVEVAACSMLSTSMTIVSDSQGDFRVDFVERRRRQRGVWGNLWADNDKDNKTY